MAVEAPEQLLGALDHRQGSLIVRLGPLAGTGEDRLRFVVAAELAEHLAEQDTCGDVGTVIHDRAQQPLGERIVEGEVGSSGRFDHDV